MQFSPAALIATAERNLDKFPDGPKKDEIRRRVASAIRQYDATGVPLASGGPIPPQPNDIPEGMRSADDALDALLAMLPPADDAEEPSAPAPATDPAPVSGGPDGKAWTAPEWPSNPHEPIAWPPTTTPESSPSTPSILGEAAAIIDGDRADTYGDPRESFARIAGMWASYLGIPLTSTDVAHMMILLKVSRAKTTPGHRDSLVDIAGYAALAERVTP